jgi:hypothetical protein
VLFPCFFFHKNRQTIELISPEALIESEPAHGLLHRTGRQLTGNRATVLGPCDEPYRCQDIEMFHDGRQRDGEGTGEVTDRQAILFAQLRQQRPPRRIGQGGKHAIQGPVTILNHKVKC